MTLDTPAAASRVKSAKHRISQSTTNLQIRRLERERGEARETLREIVAADWKTSGELRGMARKALEAAK